MANSVDHDQIVPEVLEPNEMSSNDVDSVFVPDDASWYCDVCMVVYKSDITACSTCQAPKPVKEEEVVPAVAAQQPQTWTCHICLVVNNGDGTICAACLRDKNEELPMIIGKEEPTSKWPAVEKIEPNPDWPVFVIEKDKTGSNWQGMIVDCKSEPRLDTSALMAGKDQHNLDRSTTVPGQDQHALDYPAGSDWPKVEWPKAEWPKVEWPKVEWPNAEWPVFPTGKEPNTGDSTAGLTGNGQSAADSPAAALGMIQRKKYKSQGKRHPCNVCGCTFEKPSKLKIHFRIHSGENPFKCEICGREFNQKNNLKIHMMQHNQETPEKPHTCNICGCSFDRPSKLKVHLRIHSGDRPFKCEYCGKLFNQKNNLKTHMFRRHSNQAAT